MIIITSGKKYIDIDAYASCIAYRELLKLNGIESKFVSNSVLNYSITKSLLDLPFYVDKYEISPNDKFIVIDLSNKEFFEEFIQENSIIELIDHHPGFEDYWNNKIGKKSHIEQIGSVATIIVEKYEEYNLLNDMNKDIAKLLMAAILDNTLNFTANITKQRDKDAYNKLAKLTGFTDFKTMYFYEVQNVIEQDLINAIANDIKIEETCRYLPKTLGQLTIYDVTSILRNLDVIKITMNKYNKKWLINIICLKENRSYIICSDKNIKNNLVKLFNNNSDSDIIILNPAILRKEIIRTGLEYNEN